MGEFLTFQRYSDKGLAEDLVKLLDSKGIDYQIEEYQATFDATVGTERTMEMSVKLRKEDFDAVNELLLQAASVDINKVERDYYLFEFSDEELVEIVSKPDEWSHYDYSLASQILKQRGKEISPELAAVLRKNRVQELSRPETGTSAWIIFGYFLAFMGGMIGVIMGIHLLTYKKVLPNGDKVYGFKESDRKHGLAIVVIGIVVLVVTVLLNIADDFND